MLGVLKANYSLGGWIAMRQISFMQNPKNAALTRVCSMLLAIAPVE